MFQPVEKNLLCINVVCFNTIVPEYGHIPIQQRQFEKPKQSDSYYVSCTVLHVPVSKFIYCWRAVVNYYSLHLTSRHTDY